MLDDDDVHKFIESIYKERREIIKRFLRLSIYSDKISIGEIFTIPTIITKYVSELVDEYDKKRSEAMNK